MFEFFFELVFFGIVFAPILVGLMGIWGLSKRMITWATGYFLMIIGIHAMLTFEGVTSAVDVGLKPLSAQIGEATLFGGLISPLGFDLLTVAILILVLWLIIFLHRDWSGKMVQLKFHRLQSHLELITV